MITILLNPDDPRLGRLEADGERVWPSLDCNGDAYDPLRCTRRYWTQEGVTYFVVIPPKGDREDVDYRVDLPMTTAEAAPKKGK